MVSLMVAYSSKSCAFARTSASCSSGSLEPFRISKGRALPKLSFTHTSFHEIALTSGSYTGECYSSSLLGSFA